MLEKQKLTRQPRINHNSIYTNYISSHLYLLLAFKVVVNHREPFMIQLIPSVGDPRQLL